MRRNNSGKVLQQAIQMYDFYLTDLGLYLDSHPSDKAVLAKFREINDKREAAVKVFNEKYGPLTSEQSADNDYFQWVDAPWPWERSDN